MIFQRCCRSLKNDQIWKSLVQLALNPFFSWFHIPNQKIRFGVPDPSLFTVIASMANQLFWKNFGIFHIKPFWFFFHIFIALYCISISRALYNLIIVFTQLYLKDWVSTRNLLKLILMLKMHKKIQESWRAIIGKKYALKKYRVFDMDRGHSIP